MSFLNSGLLIGLGLAVVPVLLHFLMRQKPRKLVFPALRLIEQRRRQSVRRLRLRHFWLMLLRVLALALLVLVVARPSLPPARYAFTTIEWAIVLGILALGVGGYYLALARLRGRNLPRATAEAAQSRSRAIAIAVTLTLLLLAVGWPYQRRIAAALRDPRPIATSELPVAGVLLVDTSLSMTYQQQGRTALDAARDLAIAHLETLPTGSRVAVADSAHDHPILFQATLPSAIARLKSLEASSASLTLDDRLREALRAQRDDRDRTIGEQTGVADHERRDRFLRRVYVLTDLTRSAWRPQVNTILRADLEQQANVNLHVIDVGQEYPRNRSIQQVTLSRERIAIGGELIVTAVARSQGEDIESQPLDLLLQAPGGPVQRHGQASVRLDQDLPAPVEFPLVSGWTAAWMKGEAQLPGADPLLFDNSRYFVARAAPPPPVLILAPDAAVARAWTAAVAPHEGAQAARNRFVPRFEPVHRLSQLNLTDFACVTLLNCPRINDDGWFQLGRYVEGGGGLVVVLGSTDIDSPSYNRAQAQQFLPAQLDAWQVENDWRLSLDDRDHPLFWKFRQYEDFGSFGILENDIAIRRFWKVIPSEGANVLATFTDGGRSAAILERGHGRGRTVMFTTGADLPANARQRWNNFASPLAAPWLFMAFVEQLTEYVSRFTESRQSFLAGETVVLPLEPTTNERRFLLKHPDLRQTRHDIAPGETTATLRDLRALGHYELTEAGSREPAAVFALNAAAAESDLSRLTSADLDEFIGAERYQVSRTLDELRDNINAADLGQEVSPLLLVLLVVIFCGEHLVANRFYDSTGGATGS